MSGKSQATTSPRLDLHPGRRALISLLVVIHLVAVFVPPFMLVTSGPGGPSPVADFLLSWTQPYIDIAYLNHGYAFFAPDPGPSHLVRARMEFDDGREPLELRFPDLEEQWPRLLYHRHFMLSEQLNAQFRPLDPPPGFANDPAIAEEWRQARRPYEVKWESFQQHLKAKYNADTVTLTRVRHRMIDVPEVAEQGRRLDDPETYIDLSETPAFRESL